MRHHIQQANPSLLKNLLQSRWCGDSSPEEIFSGVKMADVVLSFLLNQISTFLCEESDLLGGLQHEVQHVKDELGQMKGFLRMAEAMNENNNSELEAWVSQVRDVAYDAEDVLDEFVLRFGRHYGDGFLDRVKKLCGLINNLKARHRIATKIRAIQIRIRNISEACQRYQNHYVIFELGSNLNNIHNTWHAHDRRGDALLLEEGDLVGIEKPKRKLMDLLLTNDSQLHVISVVGMGGLGKTTVVKKVYDDATVKNRFKYHAWITVSQSLKLETLLNQAIRQIFKELDQPTPLELDTMDVSSIKQLVRDLLRQKKYIFVFDDIWRTTDWDAIRMVFPKDNCGSRIMITTRSIEVGQAAMSDIMGNIYHLEPLSKHDSITLFCKKVFRAASCPSHLKEISETIIERCAGLPLAIVVIGGVLATRSRRTEEWELFNRSLGVELARNNQLDNMTKLLSLSYYDLPDYLRICFLYLSILPEDVSVEDTKLIRLWIAEGFVQKTEGMTIEEVAAGYLNELINRSLVQVDEATFDRQVKRYCVHDIIQQIVLRKAKEQDIITVSNEQGMQFSNRVRRLVIHGSIEDTQVSYGLLKSLRSLVLFESTSSMTRSFLSKLLHKGPRLLKVLDLKGAPLDVIPEEIFKFRHLKYLSLRKTKVKSVSKSIGKLQNLETLDLKYTNVTQLPNEILKLQQLRHLLVRTAFDGFQAPRGIGNLQSLQSLCYINGDEIGIIKIVREIGKLTHLRRLAITNLRREVGKELCSSLEKLTNLRSLYIVSRKQEDVIHLQFSSIPRFLHMLKLRGPLEKVPKWLSSIHGLTGVHLFGSQLRDDPLQLLQDLPNLVELVLGQAYVGEGLCFKAGGFSGLRKLWMMNLQGLKWVRMDKGTTQFLEKLWMADCKLVEELPMGIEHLLNLQVLDFTDMSERFVKMLKDMKKESAEYKRIAHIPRVVISNRAKGEFKQHYLSLGTEMAI